MCNNFRPTELIDFQPINDKCAICQHKGENVNKCRGVSGTLLPEICPKEEEYLGNRGIE